MPLLLHVYIQEVVLFLSGCYGKTVCRVAHTLFSLSVSWLRWHSSKNRFGLGVEILTYAYFYKLLLPTHSHINVCVHTCRYCIFTCTAPLCQQPTETDLAHEAENIPFHTFFFLLSFSCFCCTRRPLWGHSTPKTHFSLQSSKCPISNRGLACMCEVLTSSPSWLQSKKVRWICLDIESTPNI